MAPDFDQDKLAEEWASALTDDAPAENETESAGGADIADDWAAALAEDEEAKLTAEKQEAGMAVRAKDMDLKDMTADFKAPRPDATKHDLDFILDIPLEVSAELGRTRLLINELLQLGQGSVVELNKLAGEPLEIFVNGKLVARGEAVVINEKFGVRLTDIISPIERVKSLG